MTTHMEEHTVDSLRQRLRKQLPTGMEKAGAAITDLRDRIQRNIMPDPDFDPSGVPDYGLRSGLSRADTPKERKAFLDKWAGPKGWTQDSHGNYALTPVGMTRLGYPHKGKPVLIDEPWEFTRHDIADISGDAPAIAGATATALLSGGTTGVAQGLLGMARAGLGGAGGKAAGETIEHVRGENLQTLSQVAGDVGTEGALAAAGEGVFRGVVGPAGRWGMAPNAAGATPERLALAQQARGIGAQPSISQIARPPLLSRMQGMVNTIFGDPLAIKNATALNKEIARLRGANVQPSISPLLSRMQGGTSRGTVPRSLHRISVGERIEKDIGRARGALARWSKSVTGKIDEMVQGKPIVPLQRLKDQADEILETLPRDRDGNITMASPELVKALDDIRNLPDVYTTGEMQQITSRLYDAIGSETIVPGITGRNARLLWRASTDTYDDIADDAVRVAVSKFRDRYKNEIRKFDKAIIQRIMKSPKLAGRLEPEAIVGAIFRKGESSKLLRVKKVVTPGTWEKVQDSAMEELLEKISTRTGDPIDRVFSGKKFLDALDLYGESTLNAMFGSSTRQDLYRLGRITQLVTQKTAFSGGLVAASIALHPIKNLVRLAKLRVFGKLLRTPYAVRWLTEGLKAPNTRRGAAAITRLGIFIKVLAEQHTDDPLPEQQSDAGRQPLGGVAADSQ